MFGNILDSIKGAVFEGEPAATPTAPAQAAPQQKSGGAPVVYTHTSSINQNMVEAIRKETFSRNTALTQLITASLTLENIIADPAVRMKAAFATSGGGRTPKDIADAVQIHLNDVDAAERNFSQAIESKVASEVGSLNAQVKSTETQINSANQEIEQITARLHTLQELITVTATKRVELMTAVTAKEAELRQAGIEFKSAAEVVRSELNNHKATILSTLG